MGDIVATNHIINKDVCFSCTKSTAKTETALLREKNDIKLPFRYILTAEKR